MFSPRTRRETACEGGGPSRPGRNLRAFATGTVLALATVIMVSCGGGGSKDNPGAVTSLTLNKSAVPAIFYNDTLQLTATANSDAQDPSVTWSSSDASFASVDSTGNVTIQQVGPKSVQITATSVSNPSVKAACTLGIGANRAEVSFLINTPTGNHVTYVRTSLVVPPLSPKVGTLFIWPGLQPDGQNYEPIDNGVLQPVLTWGPTAAAKCPTDPYGSWWISGQYVNTYGHYTGYTGCLGGDGIFVNPGDNLDMTMSLSGTVWHQEVVDTTTSQTAVYDIDMLGQDQNVVWFLIEPYSGGEPAKDAVFTNTTMKFSQPVSASLSPSVVGLNATVGTVQVAADGLSATVDNISLGRP
jgi:hypothetical protein